MHIVNASLDEEIGTIYEITKITKILLILLDIILTYTSMKTN